MENRKMKITAKEIIKHVQSLCANYGKTVNADLTDLFCEEFSRFEASVFNRAVKWWLQNNESKMPTVAGLKKKCFDFKRLEEQKALEMTKQTGRNDCEFAQMPQKPNYVACNVAKLLCCENDFRAMVGNFRLCEFHFELVREWNGRLSTRSNWTGDFSIPWTTARILEYHYLQGDVHVKSQILLELTEQQRKFVLDVDHVKWKMSKDGKIDLKR